MLFLSFLPLCLSEIHTDLSTHCCVGLCPRYGSANARGEVAKHHGWHSLEHRREVATDTGDEDEDSPDDDSDDDDREDEGSVPREAERHDNGRSLVHVEDEYDIFT